MVVWFRSSENARCWRTTASSNCSNTVGFLNHPVRPKSYQLPRGLVRVIVAQTFPPNTSSVVARPPTSRSSESRQFSRVWNPPLFSSWSWNR